MDLSPKIEAWEGDMVWCKLSVLLQGECHKSFCHSRGRKSCRVGITLRGGDKLWNNNNKSGGGRISKSSKMGSLLARDLIE